MRRLRDFYAVWPSNRCSSGWIRIPDIGNVYLDVLDLRIHQMVLPQLAHDDPELFLARTLPPPGGAFVDIGANIGILSLFALSGKAAVVHSFEPNPLMMACLRRTRAESRFAERWWLNEVAVGASSDYSSLHVNEHFSGTASLNKAWQPGGQRALKVTVVTVDHWFQVNRITSVDVVKMDVEGGELEVLEGAKSTLRNQRPYVWFEHNLPVMQRAGLAPAAILDRLGDLGYECFYDIGLLPDTAPFFRRDLDGIECRRINLLAVPNERREDFDDRVLPAFHDLMRSQVA